MTNWRRPARGAAQLRRAALEPLLVHAAELGETAMVLGCLRRRRHAAAPSAASAGCTERVAFVGVLNAGDALRRHRRARRRARRRTTRCSGTGHASSRSRPTSPPASWPGEDGERWEWAISYDRETVVECALQLMARMEPLQRVDRGAASSAITFESCPPCHASGEAPGSSERSSAPGIAAA